MSEREPYQDLGLSLSEVRRQEAEERQAEFQQELAERERTRISDEFNEKILEAQQLTVQLLQENGVPFDVEPSISTEEPITVLGKIIRFLTEPSSPGVGFWRYGYKTVRENQQYGTGVFARTDQIEVSIATFLGSDGYIYEVSHDHEFYRQEIHNRIGSERIYKNTLKQLSQLLNRHGISF